MKKTLKYIVGVLFASFAMGSCVDNDDVVVNYYASTKVTAAGFLEQNPDRFSQFINILQRTPYYALLSTYGEFTLFAPTNDAIGTYVEANGFGSVDAIPTTTCDTLARTHIIKKGAFFTTDISEGALPELNMNDAYIVLSSDSDIYNNNALVYYINKNAREQLYPLIIQKNGFRIALLSYTYATNGIEVQAPNVVNYIDKEQILADIQKARTLKAEGIIACMHWGVEYRLLPERQERQMADWLIANGVDHVIGGHPHVLQPMEVRSDEHTAARHLVVYSLGNYISNMSAPNTDGGAMVKLELKRIGHITALADCSYSLVWTSRPTLRGGGNYLLYPAANPPQNINEAEKGRLDRFLQSARNLFKKNNIAIEEYFFK